MREAQGRTDCDKRLKKKWSLEDREANWCRIKVAKQQSCRGQEQSAAFLLESASGHTPAWRMQAPHKASLLLLLSQNCFKFKIEKTFMCGSI